MPELIVRYIPVQIFNVLSWAGPLSVFVWDTKNAGRLIDAAILEAQEIDRQLQEAANANPEVAKTHPAIYAQSQVHFAACKADQTLPEIPGLPSDLFTACLLSPLKVAMLHYNLQIFPVSSLDTCHQRSAAYMQALWDSMSSKLRSRLSSELNAILLTIAWKGLDSTTYQKIFGQSQIISKVAAGFVLAQRVLGTYGVTPQSSPSIPCQNNHPLWSTFDLILENLFEQLPPIEQLEETEWEEDIHMLSFMSDQLQVVMNASAGLTRATQTTSGLSRLPIILQAANTEGLRVKACTALDSCLENLNLASLVSAVNGGVLEVATQLLNLEDPDIHSQVISIWASLIRHRGAIKQLANPVNTSERVSHIKHLVFFLNSLETSLDQGLPSSNDQIVECAAIISTIASHITKRQAPVFLQRSLALVTKMLEYEAAPLVVQWGALLFAELLNGFDPEDAGVETTLLDIKRKILSLTRDNSVETRAAMFYGLGYWLRCEVTSNIEDLTEPIRLLPVILAQQPGEGSIPARLEICRLLQHVLRSCPQWATLAYWTCLADEAANARPVKAPQLAEVTGLLSRRLGMNDARYELTLILVRAIKALRLHAEDGYEGVAQSAKLFLGQIDFRPDEDRQMDHDQEKENGKPTPTLIERIDYLIASGRSLLEVIDKKEVKDQQLSESNHEFFRCSRLSLRAYLSVSGHHYRAHEGYILIVQHHKDVTEAFTGMTAGPAAQRSKVWNMRHRVLEDSLVIAEQQGRLPHFDQHFLL